MVHPTAVQGMIEDGRSTAQGLLSQAGIDVTVPGFDVSKLSPADIQKAMKTAYSTGQGMWYHATISSGIMRP